MGAGLAHLIRKGKRKKGKETHHLVKGKKGKKKGRGGKIMTRHVFAEYELKRKGKKEAFLKKEKGVTRASRASRPGKEGKFNQ